MHWRRKWQPIPVFLPGESQGQAPVYGVAQSRTRLKWLSNLNKRKEKTLESLFDYKEIKPVNPKRNQPWIFIGRTDAGKDWRQKEKGITEYEMVGWHHRLNGDEFEQILGDNEGQGSLMCSVHKVTKNWTQLSNWTTTTRQLGKHKTDFSRKELERL